MRLAVFVTLIMVILVPGRALCDDDGSNTLQNAFDTMESCDGSSAALSGEASLIFDNPKAWATRWWLLKSCQYTVDASYYIIKRDIFGMAFLGNLLHLAKQGVMVRVNIDRKGSFKLTGAGTGADYLQELAEEGAEVSVYGTISKSIVSNIGTALKAAFSKEESLELSASATNHDKILLIDETYSLLGGRNISKDYFPKTTPQKKIFDDADILFKSQEIARAVGNAFDIEFNLSVNKTIKPDKALFNIRRDIELIGAFLLMDNWICGEALSDVNLALLTEDEVFKDYAIEIMVQDAINGLSDYGITREVSNREVKQLRALATELLSYPEIRGFHSFSPEDDLTNVNSVKIIDKTSNLGEGEDTLNQGLCALIEGAQETILLKNPYVVLTTRLAKALKEASDRGVAITIVTNSPLSVDSEVIGSFFMEKWYEYLVAIPELNFKVVGGTVPVHAKIGVIDSRICLIGSYNLDYLSGEVNGEILSVIRSSRLAAQIESSILTSNQDDTELLDYAIQRDSDGEAVDSDLSTSEIEPYILFGPQNHIPEELLEKYTSKKLLTSTLEKLLPGDSPLMTP